MLSWYGVVLQLEDKHPHHKKTSMLWNITQDFGLGQVLGITLTMRNGSEIWKFECQKCCIHSKQ
jgi:hypothetical protein